MKKISIVQDYLLLALKKDGSLPVTDRRVLICILAGGLVELKLAQSIRMDALDRIVTQGMLHPDQEYLRSLYSWIQTHEPVSVDDLAREYASWIISPRMAPLILSIGKALADHDAVLVTGGSIFSELPGFVPKPHAVEEVVKRLRQELLDLTRLHGETAVLADLLEKSGSLKRHFYMHEVDDMDFVLKNIKKYSIPLVWSEKWQDLITGWLSV